MQTQGPLVRVSQLPRQDRALLFQWLQAHRHTQMLLALLVGTIHMFRAPLHSVPTWGELDGCVPGSYELETLEDREHFEAGIVLHRSSEDIAVSCPAGRVLLDEALVRPGKPSGEGVCPAHRRQAHGTEQEDTDDVGHEKFPPIRRH
jgi:hypothetical protein